MDSKTVKLDRLTLGSGKMSLFPKKKKEYPFKCVLLLMYYFMAYLKAKISGIRKKIRHVILLASNKWLPWIINLLLYWVHDFCILLR